MNKKEVIKNYSKWMTDDQNRLISINNPEAPCISLNKKEKDIIDDFIREADPYFDKEDAEALKVLAEENIIKHTYNDKPHKSKGKNDYPFEIKDELHGADLSVFSDLIKSSKNFKGMKTGSVIVMSTGGAIDDKELKEYFKFKGSDNYLVDEKGNILGNDEIETEKGRS